MTVPPAAGGMRVFFATGEASGDFLAASLAGAMRRFAPDMRFAGVGSERMAEAGFELTTRTTGWGSLGPLEALRRIPPL
ncbi:MAG: lipid-A-disaccharide synthase, partial [Candidatus Eremiobacteraeota bacterium]|nr:lipid-A-disaccharide synthase [Candidatus Eremiobacteraeota bacterium]